VIDKPPVMAGFIKWRFLAILYKFLLVLSNA